MFGEFKDEVGVYKREGSVADKGQREKSLRGGNAPILTSVLTSSVSIAWL